MEDSPRSMASRPTLVGARSRAPLGMDRRPMETPTGQVPNGIAPSTPPTAASYLSFNMRKALRAGGSIRPSSTELSRGLPHSAAAHELRVVDPNVVGRAGRRDLPLDSIELAGLDGRR